MFETLKDFPFDIMEHNPTKAWIKFGITEEIKKAISETKMGIKQTPEHTKNRVASTIGFKQSEHQKEVATKLFQKDWLVTSPEGVTTRITNLHKFCRENGLDQGNMVKVSQGTIKQNKGWKCFKIEA